jgi:hypothetical protein
MSVRDILGGAEAAAVAAPATEAEFNFDSLISDIMENPERILDPTLSDEQILEVQKRLNPYAGIAGPPPALEKKKIAAVSYTNLREDYLRRFTLTSFVGFIYQMFNEWEVPADLRRWTPDSSQAQSKRAAGDFEPFVAAQLADQLEACAALARESADAGAQAAALNLEAAKQIALATEIPAADLAAATESATEVARLKHGAAEATERAAGLLYAATHATHKLGAVATDRLRATADSCMQYASVRDVLGKFPLPPPPSSLEAPAKVATGIIKNFLDHWLSFDPTVHVRSGHNASVIAAALAERAVGAGAVPVDTKDGSHLTVEALRAPPVAAAPEHKEALAIVGEAGREGRAALLACLRSPDLADAVLVALADAKSREAFTYYLSPVAESSAARPALDVVPPQDTFHRWAYYTEVNYEELRSVTAALYPERPDLDFAIALWNVFEGDEKSVNDAFSKHCQRYQDEVPSAIKALEFGAWSLLADFKENRKNIQFYNSNTDVLKRILDRHADDKRIGAELMRNRVRQVKAKNIAEEGPDAKGLTAYKRNLAEKGQALSSKGVEKVISVEEMRRLEKSQGSIKAAKELEQLEYLESTILRLEEMEKLRELTSSEKEELMQARARIDRAHEMANVPDDAIQVDVFTNDTATGKFGKTHFFTRSDDADEPKGAPRRPTSSMIASALDSSDHPAAHTSLAPYAAEYLAAVTAAEQAAGPSRPAGPSHPAGPSRAAP